MSHFARCKFCIFLLYRLSSNGSWPELLVKGSFIKIFIKITMQKCGLVFQTRTIIAFISVRTKGFYHDYVVMRNVPFFTFFNYSLVSGPQFWRLKLLCGHK